MKSVNHVNPLFNKMAACLGGLLIVFTTFILWKIYNPTRKY
ncbi:hypothetical protein HDF23_000179 [Mucilaginibacter lappiensis]|nr:hypothetical protein [Mucilaginibacter lappiensis]